jgi:hypothetical protein
MRQAKLNKAKAAGGGVDAAASPAAAAKGRGRPAAAATAAKGASTLFQQRLALCRIALAADGAVCATGARRLGRRTRIRCHR